MVEKFSVESFFRSDEKMSLRSFVDFLDDTDKGNGKYKSFRGKLVVQFKNFLVNEWIKKKTDELEVLIIGEAVTTRRKQEDKTKNWIHRKVQQVMKANKDSMSNRKKVQDKVIERLMKQKNNDTARKSKKDFSGLIEVRNHHSEFSKAIRGTIPFDLPRREVFLKIKK